MRNEFMTQTPVDLISPVGKVRKSVVKKHEFSRLTDGIKHPVTIRKVGEPEHEPKPVLVAIGVKVPLSALGLGHTWTEKALGDCEYGCKVYEHDVTHERVLAHNAAYGCKVGA